MRRLLTLIMAVSVLASCSPGADQEPITTIPATTSTIPATTSTSTVPVTTTTQFVDLAITSAAFEDGGPIPAEYTCDGLDLSPELDIVGLPERTEALAIIVEDPDAPLGVWYHWVEFDIPASPGSYRIPREAAGIGVEGVNSWNLPGYKGPCPPEGEEHRYVFQVYALATNLELPPGVDAEEVKATIGEHLVDDVALTGIYGR